VGACHCLPLRKVENNLTWRWRGSVVPDDSPLARGWVVDYIDAYVVTNSTLGYPTASGAS